MLACDDKNSVLGEVGQDLINGIAYSPYGHRSADQPTSTHLGYNGELREPKIGWYLLGNGYRAFNPRLMRFQSPDSWSPFGEGGLNAYMYCLGNPIKYSDATGHNAWFKIFTVLMNLSDDTLRTTTANAARTASNRVTTSVASGSTPGILITAADDPLNGFTIYTGKNTVAPSSSTVAGRTMTPASAPRTGGAGAPTRSSSAPVKPSTSKVSDSTQGPRGTTATPPPKASGSSKSPKQLTKEQFKKLGPVSRLEYLSKGGVDPTQKGFHGALAKTALDVRKPNARYGNDAY